PRTPSTSSSNSRCRTCCMLCRANVSSVSQVGLDAATDSVVFSLTGGVSFCSGVDAPEVLDANRRLHRLHSFTHLPTLPQCHSLPVRSADGMSDRRLMNRAMSALDALSEENLPNP